LAEEQVYGLTSLKKHAEKLGLPLPTYSMEGDSLVLTIYRSKAAATLALGKDVMESLSKAEWARLGMACDQGDDVFVRVCLRH